MARIRWLLIPIVVALALPATVWADEPLYLQIDKLIADRKSDAIVRLTWGLVASTEFYVNH